MGSEVVGEAVCSVGNTVARGWSLGSVGVENSVFGVNSLEAGCERERPVA